MLEKVVAALKANPIEAIAAFNKPDGGFRDRDLYVFCFTMGTGKYTAIVFPELMNTDVRDLMDDEGNQYGRKIYDAAKEGQVTMVSYKALKPGGNYAVPKISYVTRVADQGCGVGYYQY